MRASECETLRRLESTLNERGRRGAIVRDDPISTVATRATLCRPRSSFRASKSRLQSVYAHNVYATRGHRHHAHAPFLPYFCPTTPKLPPPPPASQARTRAPHRSTPFRRMPAASASMPTPVIELDSRLSAVRLLFTPSTSPHAAASRSFTSAFTISTVCT
eukprot:4886940-Pleurochrysis_carterae.AAC.2